MTNILKLLGDIPHGAWAVHPKDYVAIADQLEGIVIVDRRVPLEQLYRFRPDEAERYLRSAIALEKGK